jgi:O-antigen/teichoic acid export membrane protein
MIFRQVIPYRYATWLICGLSFVASLWLLFFHPMIGAMPALILGALTALGCLDYFQTKQAIRRNYPILAHFRFFFETIRPEIRQYFLETIRHLDRCLRRTLRVDKPFRECHSNQGP